jgi:hypothetical protein
MRTKKVEYHCSRQMQQSHTHFRPSVLSFNATNSAIQGDSFNTSQLRAIGMYMEEYGVLWSEEMVAQDASPTPL